MEYLYKMDRLECAVGTAKRCPADTSSIALVIAERASRTERDWPAPQMFDADVSAQIVAPVAPLDEPSARPDRELSEI